MTAPTAFEDRLRRLWPLFLLLAAAVTYAWVLYDPYQIDGDAVSYMDISDLIRTHQWAGVVNAYWNPLYPAFLAAGHSLFHSTRTNELHAFYVVNYVIFLLQLVAIVAFVDALSALRARLDTGNSTYTLSRTGLRYLAVALLLISSQRELSIGKVRPDALLQALLLLGLAALLRHLATGYLRHAAWMGAAFGLAYLTKSFAFLFSLLAVAMLVGFRLLWRRHKPLQIAASAAVALVCFGIVAGPYIAALSRQKGHFDFGDSGALNYAWFVGGTEKMHLEPDMAGNFGSATVHLTHPEVKLPVAGMDVYSYAALPWGTNPDWFDTTYFNDGVKPHFNLQGELSRIARDLVLVVRYVLNHPEPMLLLAVLLALGSRLSLGWRPAILLNRSAHTAPGNAFWLPPVLLALALWCIYGMVNIEERYVTAGYLTLLLPLFATLKISASTLKFAASQQATRDLNQKATPNPSKPADPDLNQAANVPHSSQPHRDEWDVRPHPALSALAPVASQQATPNPSKAANVPHSSQPHRDEWDVRPHPAPTHLAPAALILLLFLLATGESVRQLAELRRQESLTGGHPGWYDPQNFEAAAALTRLGLKPGDPVACIGTQACLRDFYWARLAGVRILTEIYDQDQPVYDYLRARSPQQRAQAASVLAAQGATVLIGAVDPARITGRDDASAGWTQLAGSLYALPLPPPQSR